LDFASLVGVGKDTFYKWKQQFERLGPAGLLDQPRGGREGSRLPELTKRTILMLKEQHPEWGCQRISDLLARGPALPASASAVARVLHEAGYEAVEESTHPHPDHVRRFERAQPNQLWQTDLFTFVLKRQNRRVYLVAFLDDHSRFLVSYGLHASQATALLLEVLEAGIANYGPPEEILTDNGAQYVTWRGKSQFTRGTSYHVANVRGHALPLPHSLLGTGSTAARQFTVHRGMRIGANPNPAFIVRETHVNLRLVAESGAEELPDAPACHHVDQLGAAGLGRVPRACPQVIAAVLRQTTRQVPLGVCGGFAPNDTSGR